MNLRSGSPVNEDLKIKRSFFIQRKYIEDYHCYLIGEFFMNVIKFEFR